MPSSSEKQRRFFGAELARRRAGKKTKTGLTEAQMSDYAKQVVPPKGKRPHGSGEFTAEDMKRGYKKGSPVTEKDLCDVYQPPTEDEYGKVKEQGGDGVRSDY